MLECEPELDDDVVEELSESPPPGTVVQLARCVAIKVGHARTIGKRAGFSVTERAKKTNSITNGART